ncbi:MAG: 2-C-methyl-D-erythritol 4-phosphate cytidylyltransferase [Clostridia bacterium]|nr:2-C-methyl-D-erythritol 4-phosphate cytidylyltransferase [Clostridia bacterium]
MNAAIIVAAGRGERMHSDKNKVFLPLLGVPVIVHTVRAFSDSGLFGDLIVVCSTQNQDEMRELLSSYGFDQVRLVPGGATRQASVLCGLRALPKGTNYVAIHDGARPLVSRRVLEDALRQAADKGNAIVAVPLKDTIKRAQPDGLILETPDRASLYSIQTPQVFDYAEIIAAHETYADRQTATDDAMLMEWTGKAVYLSMGDPENLKITTPEDLAVAEQILIRRGMKEADKPMEMRIGHGYDVHKLVPDRDLILCGVKVPYERGLLGHSDADVAAHALMDAMLGAAAMGDIGYHFPDTDPAYSGADSMKLLERVREIIAADGWKVSNADLTIICQRPKLRPFIEAMRDSLAGHLNICRERISVKATTTEHLGFEGEGLGISTHAVVMLERGGSDCLRDEKSNG